MYKHNIAILYYTITLHLLYSIEYLSYTYIYGKVHDPMDGWLLYVSFSVQVVNAFSDCLAPQVLCRLRVIEDVQQQGCPNL